MFSYVNHFIFLLLSDGGVHRDGPQTYGEIVSKAGAGMFSHEHDVTTRQRRSPNVNKKKEEKAGKKPRSQTNKQKIASLKAKGEKSANAKKKQQAKSAKFDIKNAVI